MFTLFENMFKCHKYLNHSIILIYDLRFHFIISRAVVKICYVKMKYDIQQFCEKFNLTIIVFFLFSVKSPLKKLNYISNFDKRNLKIMHPNSEKIGQYFKFIVRVINYDKTSISISFKEIIFFTGYLLFVSLAKYLFIAFIRTFYTVHFSNNN